MSQNNQNYSKGVQSHQNAYLEQNNTEDGPERNEELEWGDRNDDEEKNLNINQNLKNQNISQSVDNPNQNKSNEIKVESKVYKYTNEEPKRSDDTYYLDDSKNSKMKDIDNGESKKANKVNIKNDSYKIYNSNLKNNGFNGNNYLNNNNSQNIKEINNYQKSNNDIKINNDYNNKLNLENKNSSNLKYNNHLNQNNNNFENNKINNEIYDNKSYKKQGNNSNSNYYNNQNNNNMKMINNNLPSIPNNNSQNNIMNNQIQNNSNSLPNNIYMKNQKSNNFPNNNFINNNSNNNINLMGNVGMNNNPNNNYMNNRNINNFMNQGNINSSNNIMLNQNNQNINSHQNIPSKNQNNPHQILSELNKFSFSRKFITTKTGLINIVETSYLNAVLQLIGSFHFFVNYFLNPKHSKYIYDNIRKMPLSFVIQRLFLHLYPENDKEGKSSYKPASIMQILAQLNSVYNSNKKRNPNDLLNFILDTLHKELNTCKNNTNQLLNSNSNDRKDVIKKGIQIFANFNKSIISDNFNWFEIKEIKCSTCKKIFFSFNTFNTFELDIFGTYKNKNNPITILDCLQNYISDKSQFLICNKCKNKSKFMKNTKIYSSRHIFVFSLDRKNLDNNLLKIPFIIEQNINICNYVEKKNAPFQFQLAGILSYYMNSQKYISFCLSPIDNQWYICNDEFIQSTQINEVLNCHNNNNNYIPCILVYKS